MGATGSTSWLMSTSDFDRMVEVVARDADELIGPVLTDGVIRLGPIDSADALPTGVTDVQDGGSYRAEHRDHAPPLRFS